MIYALDPLVLILLLLPLLMVIGLSLYYPIIPLIILCFFVPLESLIPLGLFPILGALIVGGYVLNSVMHMNHIEHNNQVILDYVVMGLLVIIFIWNPKYAWGTIDPFGNKEIFAFTYIQLALFYFLGSRLLRGNNLAWLGLALMVGTTLSTIYAIHTTGFNGFYIDYSHVGFANRLKGAEGDPNYFSAYALCGLALLPAVQKICRNKLQLLLVTLIGGFQIIIILLSMSKTAFLALAFLMLLWLYSLRFSSIVRNCFVIGIVILFITAMIIPRDYWIYMYDKVIAGITQSNPKMGTSMEARYNYWWGAYLAFKSAPIMGIGTGQFPWFTAKCSGLGIDYGTVVHNAYLSVLAENGLIGITLYLGMIAFAMYRFFVIARKGNTENLRIMALSGFFAFVMILFMALTLSIQYNKFIWVLAGSSIALTLDYENEYVMKRLTTN